MRHRHRPVSNRCTPRFICRLHALPSKATSGCLYLHRHHHCFLLPTSFWLSYSSKHLSGVPQVSQVHWHPTPQRCFV
uniref:Uncharacterized protein n=1 Tax=Zea mays TaxID=4577 RepID=C0PJM9_MAIZE|nr:unknown [Zea mays]